MPQAETPTAQFEITPKGPYSLDAAARFLAGFSPLGGTRSAHDAHVHLAFVVDGTDEAVGVCLQQQGETVVGEIAGTADPGAVSAQVARILSLDVDGTRYAEIGERDPVIGEIQARFPGLRPVSFYSPFEAGAWALISQRVQMAQAAKVKARMAQELGQEVDIHGDRVHTFPPPARLLELTGYPGLFGRKVEYLRGLADAALDGRLDADYLRDLSPEEALAALRRIPGVGDFSARLILLRGAAIPDGPPAPEPHVLQALQLAYGLEGPLSEAELERLTEGWRPFRTWVTFLLRVMLQEERRPA
ncbi:MAG TPA: DNA-3-methyladenine glycosylase 2 family protein [Chloroflexota bacterium]